MDSHINITLVLKGKKTDIRVPRNVEVSHLIRELDDIFNSESSKPRRKYQLYVMNKGLILDEGKYLKNSPITTGDIIEIMEDSTFD